MAPRNSEESDAHGHAALEADAADPAATAAPPACATASEVVAPGSLKKWVFIVNPASGSGSTGKKWPRMLQRFKDAATSKGWSHVDEVAALMTTKQGEATELVLSNRLTPVSIVFPHNMCVLLCMHAATCPARPLR